MGWRDWLSSTVFRRFDLAENSGVSPSTSTTRADGLSDSPTPQLKFLQEQQEGWSDFATRLDSLSNLLTGLGDESRDKGASARPDTTSTPLSYAELSYLFWRNGLAQRVVTCVAEDAVKNGWSTQEDFSEFDQAMDLQQKMGQALTMARLYGGSGVFLATDAKDLSKPMAPTERLVALHVFERIELQPVAWEGDLRSPQFRKVKTWQLNPMSPALSGGWAGTAKIDASRILYVDGADIPAALRLANMGFGGSVLDACWASIRNRTTIGQAGATMAQDFRVDVLKVVGLAARSVSDQAAWWHTRMQMMAKMRSVLSLIVVGENEEYQSRQTSVSGWKDISSAAAEDLAAETGIPLTRLYGLAPGGLNADGAAQREMHAALVARTQEQRLRGPLQRYYEIAGQTIGRKAGRITFLPVYQPTPQEAAQLDQTKAQTDAIRIESGVLDADHVALSRFGEASDGEILPLTEQDIAARAEEAEALAEAAIAAANQPAPAEPEEPEDGTEEDDNEVD